MSPAFFLFSFSSYCSLGIKEGDKPIQTVAPQWENSIQSKWMNIVEQKQL
jgi:hypothetical protein